MQSATISMRSCTKAEISVRPANSLTAGADGRCGAREIHAGEGHGDEAGEHLPAVDCGNSAVCDMAEDLALPITAAAALMSIQRAIRV